MQEGHILCHDGPEAVLADARLSEAYCCRVRVSVPPAVPGVPFVLPQTVAAH